MWMGEVRGNRLSCRRIVPGTTAATSRPAPRRLAAAEQQYRGCSKNLKIQATHPKR